MRSTLSYDKLVQFLYLLMRDAAPTGDVVTAARTVAHSSLDEEIVYTSKELEAYAKRIAMEMLP